MRRYAFLGAAVAASIAVGALTACGSSDKSTTASTTAAPKSQDTHGARVVHYTLSGRDEIAVVPRKTNHRLIVLLHGRGAGPEQFLSDQLFTSVGHPGYPVVVMLNGGDHSYWHDRASGKWASMVLNRAIPDAQRRFHTKGKIAIGGISMGGYGALHIASLRPKTFCAVGGHSAALWQRAGATAPGAFDNAIDFNDNNVFKATGKLKKLRVWLDAGDQDAFRNADAALARKLSIPLHVFPGGHDSAYWNSHMSAYLAFYAHACS
jgi:S-formylglutathione hydrolase FrmB